MGKVEEVMRQTQFNILMNKLDQLLNETRRVANNQEQVLAAQVKYYDRLTRGVPENEALEMYLSDIENVKWQTFRLLLK